MNKKMNLFIKLILIAFICNNFAYAQKVISGSKLLPLEINLMIESLQSESNENYDKVFPLIMSIDQYARSMSKEDIFLLGKIEVYKTFLKNYGPTVKTPINGDAIMLLRKTITKTNDPFTKWFLQALLKDSIDLIGNPSYKEFLLQRNNNIKVEKIEYRKLEKKSELLQYWVSKIPLVSQEEASNSFKNELTPKMLEALKNIKNSFYLMAKQATLTPMASSLKDESELKFFLIKDLKPTTDKKTESIEVKPKSVEEILAPITEASTTQDLPLPSKENWLEDENAPLELQNLPKPNNDADWLQDF